MVRDEADIIEHTINNLLHHVDHIIVADNMSTDGTREILERLPVELLDDTEIGYYQSIKTSELAQKALLQGHSWVIPCDADEYWYVGADIRRAIRDYFAGLAPDVQMVRAELYNHIPAITDDVSEENPFKRIGWRKREPGALPKVACRLHHSLVIHAGNHSASYGGTGLAVGGLVVRHFSWRDREKYLLKIRNGQQAYAATNLPEGIGVHWRMFANASDDAVMEHFDTWFFSKRPRRDDTLIYDPAPLLG